MKLLLLLSFISLSAALLHEFVEEWHLWKNQHKKGYRSQMEELERHAIWLSNKKYIEEHNIHSDVFGYTLAMNHLGDLSADEYNELYLSNKQRHTSQQQQNVFRAPKEAKYADSINWREKGVVTSIKNQRQCSASYAFAATGALEGANVLTKGTLTTLSEQNIVDCSVPYGNHGCRGGSTYIALTYVVDNGGIDTEGSYTFNGKQGLCHYNSSSSGATATGVISITSGSESDLLAAVATVGPVAVAVDASNNAFRFYQSGVFDSSSCSNTKLNHAMLVTGYGSYNGTDYWIVKNSWSKNWGDNGYILMSRNKHNQCGIATDALYPTL